MATLLYRLGRAAFRRRRLVAGSWLAFLVIVGAGAATSGAQLDDAFTIPGSESQEALDTMAQTFPAAAGATAQLVFVAPDGSTLADPDVAAGLGAALAAAAESPQVVAVIDPQTAGTVSADGTTGLAQVQFDGRLADIRDDSLTALEASTDPARGAGLQVVVGGEAFGTTGVPVGPKELLGVGVALIVLVVTFGSLLAAGLPLLTALVGVIGGLAGLIALSSVITVSSSAPTLALMLGLAVGIDYALFILSRHRSQLAAGMDVEESVARANATAGTAVVFAGLTVIIALAGLTVVQIPFLSIMGLAAAATVLLAVLVAVTLLPALLGFAGRRLVPEPGSRTARRENAAASHESAPGQRSGGERWACLVTRRPLVTIAAVVVTLGVVAIPALDLKLALPANGTAAEGTGPREAYDIVSEKFGVGFNGPLIVLVDTTGAPAPQAASAAVVEGLQGLADTVAVSPPQPNAEGTAAIVSVISTGGPDSDETKALVQEIRDRAVDLGPATGTTIAVTGATAIGIDVSDRLSGSLLPFTALVVGLALILLLMVFRSLVVPIKATAGFLLSIAAAFGAVVAVFQWGWLADLVGVTGTGPVISFMPVIIIAVLFGLAMDYEVFLVSRMREEYVATGEPTASVIAGARHASRVVVAAALIMCAVFASFVLVDDAVIKPIAFALAFGVLVDAFVVRMTLVPAVLAAVGHRAWWLPAWLERLLPDLDIEGARLAPLSPGPNVGAGVNPPVAHGGTRASAVS